MLLPSDFDVALVLGGGNALGAYHLGVSEALFSAGIAPNWIVGTSIGAVTAAILAGNPPEERLPSLRRFWDQASQMSPALADLLPDELRARFNTDFGLAALLFGRPGLFGPRYPGLWSLLPGMPGDTAIRDHRPLKATIESLVDFDRLNRGDTRVSICSIDMETGDEVWFDTNEGGITAEHILASTALTPLFAPVEVGGRLLCDAGFGNNLPIDRVFVEPIRRNTLCFALDPYHLGHGRPETLDQTIARVQDLAFAMQTHRTIAALKRERDLMRQLDPETPSAILAHLAYRAPGHQRSLKPLDFSRTSISERVARGRADAEDLLARLVSVPRDAPLAYVTIDTAPDRHSDAPLPGSARPPQAGRPKPGQAVDDAARR